MIIIMLSYSYRVFVTLFLSNLLFFSASSSYAQDKNTDFLPPILSLLLEEPGGTTVVFDTPTDDGVFIVPEGVTSINVVALGASGGDGANSGDGDPGQSFIDEDGNIQFIQVVIGNRGRGGAGGQSEGTIAVTPGEQLTIIVGTEGERGKLSGIDDVTSLSEGNGGNGGGRSEILRNGTALIVAGGGGGGGAADRDLDGGNGGAGGGLSGGNGGSASPSCPPDNGCTNGFGGQGAVGNLPGLGTTLIVGSRDTPLNMFGISGRFGLQIQATNGSGPGQDIDFDGVVDVIGAPLFGALVLGGTGSGVNFSTSSFGGGGSNGNTSGGGGGGGYAGGGAGLPRTFIIGPKELEIEGEIIDAGSIVGFSAGGGGGGGSSLIPEGGSTEAGVNRGNGSIVITY